MDTQYLVYKLHDLALELKAGTMVKQDSTRIQQHYKDGYLLLFMFPSYNVTEKEI